MAKLLLRLDILGFYLIVIMYHVKHGWDLERPLEGKMLTVFLKPCLEGAAQLLAELLIW